MADLRKNGNTSNLVRFVLKNSTTGVGLTGLSSASSGLIISTIADNEASATVYTVAGSTIESISTLGTFAAPTATKCRFKEVDATNHPGLYEFQFADARFAVSSGRRLVISVSGATNLLAADYEVQTISADMYDAVRLGLTALPNAAAESAGGLFTRGTGAGQINQDANGRVDTRTAAMATDVLTAAALAADAVTEIQNGLATASSITTLTAYVDTEVAAILAAVDTEVAAIKAKTDNLPTDPADASDIAASFSTVNSTLATIAAYIDTEVAAIKAKTDNLPLDPADASDIAATLATIISYIDTEVAAILAAVDTEVADIKAKTDNLPADPADASDIAASFASIAATLATLSGYVDTEVAAILAAVDTEVAAIKAKTDNLPTDPADASDIAASFSSIASTLATIAAYVDTEVAAIKAKTDNLPSDPADASDIAASFASIAAAIAVIDDFVDTEVLAIKVVTDKINTAMELDGSVYRFTTNALEMAPGGGSGGDATEANQLLILDQLDAIQSHTDMIALDSEINILPVVVGNTMNIVRGCTLTANFSALGSLTGRDALYITVKKDVEDADTEAIFKIEETAGLQVLNGSYYDPAAGTIVVTNATTGALAVTLSAAAAKLLNTSRRLYYDMKMVDGAVVTQLISGYATVTGDVTRLD